jgi:hypothetical protein
MRPAKVKCSLPPRAVVKVGTAMENEQPHVQRWMNTVDGGKPMGVPLVADRWLDCETSFAFVLPQKGHNGNDRNI